MDRPQRSTSFDWRLPERLRGVVAAVAVLAVVGSARAADSQLQADAECVLALNSRMSVRPRGKGKKVRLRRGVTVTVIAPRGRWVHIETRRGRQGYIKKRVIGVCQLAEEEPAVATTTVDELMSEPESAVPGTAAWEPSPSDERSPELGESVAALSSPAEPTSATQLASSRMRRKQSSDFELWARYRLLMVPGALFDIFYTKHRPVSGEAVGGGFALVRRAGFRVEVCGDYTRLAAPDGTWQKRDTDEGDGDWTVLALSYISGDINVVFDVGGDVFSVLFGVGLGVGYVSGDITTYNDPTGPSGEIEKQDFPRVMPLLNVQLSPRIVLWRHVVLQVDLGFRNALFGGAAVGIRL